MPQGIFSISIAIFLAIRTSFFVPQTDHFEVKLYNSQSDANINQLTVTNAVQQKKITHKFQSELSVTIETVEHYRTTFWPKQLAYHL